MADFRSLREPFPPEQIGKVNKGFGEVDFVGHAAVTDRLNAAFPDWTYDVEPVVITGKDGLPHVLAVQGTMRIDGVERSEAGDVEHMTRYGDELKKAISDFICRAAMRFGVALDLWSKEDLTSVSAKGKGGAETARGEAGSSLPASLSAETSATRAADIAAQTPNGEPRTPEPGENLPSDEVTKPPGSGTCSHRYKNGQPAKVIKAGAERCKFCGELWVSIVEGTTADLSP